MSDFVGTTSQSLDDVSVLVKQPLAKDIGVVISDSTNRDTGASPTTMLPPGTILLGDSSKELYYDDTSGGVASAQATVTASETADADWQNKIITIARNGVTVVAVTLGGADDTDNEVRDALNADATFAANFIASVAGSRVVIKDLQPGANVHLLVTCDLADAFGASGTAARGTDADWVVCTRHVNQLDPTGTAADARANIVRCGEFDESSLRWSSSATPHQDFFRVMYQRGARFV